ncbi:hypothetical protein [Tropicimonas isoalkanivorans]|uniref:Uncharacterized protein n=1 Tax=Tropicimonas isoalkanivorans TaxID=441112 RepID=A0A1I1IID4_9RHOB|nr:hypothetical protein [Tropicimonas isoalkanivorans]SFC35432.1 hypothetical protein SAMN04488094_10484 [Tropicimonas isoalkanivorans]
MTKTAILLAASLALAAASAHADSGKTPPGKRSGGSWGDATSGAISGGFNQGAHASDPSGDGKGKGSNDEPRSGLANAGGKKGDLSNTMDALGL